VYKFIHAADIHLDSPLRGLSHYEGAPVDSIRGATREALKGLVQTAIEEKVAFVVLAGDLFDGDWNDYNTGLFFAGQMSKLRENDIHVFYLAGNHDATSRITKTLKMPDNVHRFSSSQPETITLEDIRVALHGQSFARPDVKENLAVHYPPAKEGFYNIGVLHTGITGREGHELYAPCKIQDLTSKAYDYWALGHIHKREILLETPLILFPGNIQGRHIRETGPKGCTLATVEDDGSTDIEEVPLDVVRWARVEIDASGSESGEAVMFRVRSALEKALAESDGRLLAVRVTLTGSCGAHEDLNTEHDRWVNQIRVEATDIGGSDLWIENVVLKTNLQVDLEKLTSGDGPIGDLLKFINQIEESPIALTELADTLSILKSKLPIELRHGEEAIDLDSPERLREIIADARQVLLPYLMTKTFDP
jgi:DNA repair exonuclease SbcCD nuclease subunit